MSDIKQIVEFVKQNAEYLKHNKILFDIYEGDLAKYVLEDLQEQLSPRAYSIAKQRIAPINILRRIVDKLSKIYVKPPRRTAMINGVKSEKDQALLDWYCLEMQCDVYLNLANELFNLSKTVSIEPFIDKGMPRIRAIPSDRFLYYSDDMNDPTNPTAWIKIMGSVYDHKEKKDKAIFFVYTDEQFIPIREDGVILTDLLLKLENPEGVNPYGKIPSVYVNRSFHNLVPPIDSDVLRMTKLIPVLLADLNYAVQFQSFSLIYGIDVDAENMVMAPNSFWNLKSDKTSDTKPEIGTIKPEVDITQVMEFIKAQLILWLNSKNIRPGSVGDLSAESMSSGISKIVDEMDTFEDRQKQVQFFQKAEEDMWELISKNLHPYWRKSGLIDTTLDFSPNVEIQIEFAEQLPLADRSKLIDDAIKELDKQLTTKKKAIQMINPDMSMSEVEEFLGEIEEENSVILPDVREVVDVPEQIANEEVVQ
jgi:hypothetical protein